MTRMGVTAVKTFLASLVVFATYMAGLANVVTVVLVFIMFIDLASGLTRAWATKTANSTICLAGIIKKVAVLMLLAMTTAIEFLFMHMGQDTEGFILMSVTCFFIVNECLSIMENFAQIGVPIPPVLYNALEKLNKDPSGKEYRIARDPILESMDKQKLIQEVQIMQQESIEQKHTKDGESVNG